MSIKLTSRYNYSVVDYLRVTEKSDTTPIVLYQADDLQNAAFIYHLYSGESLFQLSYQYYQRPDMWWAIVEYNPEVTDFFNIPHGRTLRIPVV